ncbi:MAG: hypothetical protein GX608_05870 [Lentisphaerae bacterium]|nr:hypothetical protein [Lentisphaerota bacterium]
MADITIKCAQCGREITVSEHVSVSSLPCGKCGGSIPIPGRQAVQAGLRLKAETPDAPAAGAQPDAGPGEKNTRSSAPFPTAAIPAHARGAAHGGTSPAQLKSRTALRRMKHERRRQKLSSLTLAVSWAIFLLLGGGLAYFRFVYAPASIPEAQFNDIKRIAVYAIAACYCITILMAFKDDIFQGLLSLVVPLYPFYYLLSETSSTYFRAATAALLVGFGFDFGLAIQKTALAFFDFVNRWINTV